MNRNIFIVAKWEFFRFFKWRDQLTGILVMLISSGIGFAVVKFAQSSNQIDLALTGSEENLVLPSDSTINLNFTSDSIESLKPKLADKQLDGILAIERVDGVDSELQIDLYVLKQPSWMTSLQPALDELKLRRAIEKTQLTPERVEQIFSPQKVNIISTTSQSVSTGDYIAAFVMGGCMVMVSFLGLSFFMVGVTGEKQQRITEQVVSAISPQSWIDGKLLGLTAAAFASTFSLLFAGLALYGVAAMAGYGFAIPDSLTRWELLPILAILFLGGAVFWNCFYAAVSAIINDPNTSARGGLLFLPMLPLSASFFAIPQPDGIAMRVLSLVPGASSTAMPIRLLIGDVAWWELIVCCIALVFGIAVLRLVAGRIFAAGIMLYGKEPSWLEIMQWACRN